MSIDWDGLGIRPDHSFIGSYARVVLHLTLDFDTRPQLTPHRVYEGIGNWQYKASSLTITLSPEMERLLSYCTCFFLILASRGFARASSFYDNPEQDPLAPVQDSPEELHRKWDAEVKTVCSGQKLFTMFLDPS